MGQEISLQCALHGLEVALYDISDKALATARAWHEGVLGQFVSQGQMDQAAAQAVLDRITPTNDPAVAASEADLISESVPEDPTLKGKVFAQFNRLCPTRTIFTTNTSTLVPSMIAGATGRPARFLALHFHPHTWISNVVDIMPHPGTSPEMVDTVVSFAKRIGQIPIVLKNEHHQYVFNDMLGALFGSALKLVTTGVASYQDVDRAWMGIMKMPVGPFGIMDSIGLDTNWQIMEYWLTVIRDLQLRRNADLLKTYVTKGHLGVKSGQGFYTYPNPAYEQPGFLTGE